MSAKYVLSNLCRFLPWSHRLGSDATPEISSPEFLEAFVLAALENASAPGNRSYVRSVPYVAKLCRVGYLTTDTAEHDLGTPHRVATGTRTEQ